MRKKGIQISQKHCQNALTQSQREKKTCMSDHELGKSGNFGKSTSQRKKKTYMSDPELGKFGKFGKSTSQREKRVYTYLRNTVKML